MNSILSTRQKRPIRKALFISALGAWGWVEQLQPLDFQAWVLTVKGSKADIVCHDGDYNEVYSHHFYITDYPAPGVELWLERTDRNIILLPEEH
ncbi:MAG: DUF6876 family protein [Rhodopila sp.]